MMKSALIDASSAILLYKAKLFHKMAAAYRLWMVPTVYREITVRHHTGADVFHRAKESGKIRVVKLTSSNRSESLARSLDAGEAETMWAYNPQGVHFIIMDDGKGAHACRTLKIPYINALLCPNLLYWSQFIDSDTRCRAFVHLQRIGRYAPCIVDFAQNSTVTALRPFLP